MRNIFSKITRKTLLQNRTRSLITVIGVILSTAMITAVTTFGVSFREFLIDYAIQKDGNWHTVIHGLTEEMVKEITDDPSVFEASTLSELGYAPLTSLSDASPETPYLYLQSLSEKSLELLPVGLSKGRLPEKENELLVPDYFYGQMPDTTQFDVGRTLTLNVGKRTLDGEFLTQNNPYIQALEDMGDGEIFTPEYTKSFTIVGSYSYFPDSCFGYAGHEVFCGPVDESVNETVDKLDDAHASETLSGKHYTVYLRFQDPKDTYQLTEELTNGCDGASWSFNTELLRWYGTVDNDNFLPVLTGLSAILILIIMGGSVLLIYNAFSISLRERTVQFGLLSSLGATKKQLRHSVIYEAFIISAIGIPLGLFFGIGGIGVTLHLIGSGITEWIHGVSSGIPLKLSPFSIFVSIASAWITVLVSAWIPSRRIRKLSPMDAIRSATDITVRPGDVKTSRLIFRLFHTEGMLAQKHYKRDRRKYRATILSLSMSIILFVSSVLFTEYLMNTGVFVLDAPERELECTLSGQTSDSQVNTVLSTVAAVNESTDSAIKEINEFLTLHTSVLLPSGLLPEKTANYYGLYKTADESGYYLSTSLYVLPDTEFTAYADSQGIDAAPYLNASNLMCIYTSHIALYNSETERYEKHAPLDLDNESTLTLGTLNVSNSDKTPSTPVFTDTASLLLGNAAKHLPEYLREYEAPLSLVIPESIYRAHTETLDIFYPSFTLLMKCPEYKNVYQHLTKAFHNAGLSDIVVLTNLAEKYETDRNLLTAIRVLTYGFVILISLIATVNVFHTISTNLMLRRREFAMLRSIGMTPKAFQKMLNYECLIYGLRAILYGIPVSLLISFLLWRIINLGADVSYFFPWKALLFSAAGIFLIVFLTMFYAARKVKKHNIIDELKLM